MILDANTADRQVFEREFDACVIGTGPAGICIARKLAEAGFDVALMEGGGLDYTPESQELYVGDVIGHDYYQTDVTRLRFFGGTSNHWGGRSRTLEPHDFEHHPYHPLSGWPIDKSDLEPYAEEADAVLDLPPAEVFPDRVDDYAGPDMPIIKFRQSPPTRFGEKYHDELAASERITLAVNANLVDLRLDPTLTTVETALFKSYTPGDAGFPVRARLFCLCLGGLENPRFLLNASSQIPEGIGNGNDLVGRYFAEHMAFKIGSVLFESEVPTGRGYEPTAELMDEYEILNFNLLVGTKGLEFTREAARSVICSGEFSERLAEKVLGRPLDCDFGGLGEYWENLNAEDRDQGWLAVIIEQSLNPDSRVTLAEERDIFGHRRLALDWQFTELDAHTTRTAATLIGQRFAEQGLGRVQIRDWLMAEQVVWPNMGEGQGEVGLHHHMCTTRMSADPAEGVVDADCRIHGMSNLYIGGSSVFSTGGHANPTYTVVQLALRLGDHLVAQLSA